MMATDLNTAPTDVYLSFVESLFGNRKTLFTGMIVHLLTYAVVYMNTVEPIFLAFIFSYMTLAYLRIYWCNQFDKVDLQKLVSKDIADWENRYLFGAMGTAIILGCATGYSIFFLKDNFATLACITVTMGTMVSVVGRNFGSARVTNLLPLGACVPIIAALLFSGSGGHVFLAILFVPFTLTISVMAKGIRDFLYQNVIASREIAQIAGRFNVALNTMTHGLFMLDSDGVIQVANRKAYDLFQLNQNLQVKDRSIFDVLALGLEQTTTDKDARQSILLEIGDLIVGKKTRALVDLSSDLCLEFTVSRRDEGDVVLIFEDVTSRVRAERRLTYIAHFDAMTGLPNRGHFADLVVETVRKQKVGTFAGFMVLDIDEFKTVNDKKGHIFGDRLLCVVADAIQHFAGDKVICSRMMGDEFLLYFTAVADVDQLKLQMHDFHQTLRGNYEVDGQIFNLSFSAGYVCVDGSNIDIEDMQFRADLALAETKLRQRGGCTGFAAEMDARYLDRLALKDDLRLAIDRAALTVSYQPMFSPDGLHIDCCEALARWNHPEKGPIGPNVFIQLAEEMGVVAEITTLILRQACFDCTTWPGHIHVSVNLSAQDLLDETIVTTVKTVLTESGLAPERLHLEVTESSFINEAKIAIRVLEQFREFGITIAIDDFGTGYSSLSYLDGLPLDIVKIDRSFVLDICENERRFRLLRGAVNLSRDLGMKIVIEGVETVEQLALISLHDCADLIQGYVFSRPVPNSAIVILAEALEFRDNPQSTLVA